MASTQKTPSLLLNKWLGTDKPKKDDFNTDNDKIDAAYGGLSTRVSSAEGKLTALTALTAHTGNAAIHVTAAEKAKWNSGGDNSGGGNGGGETGTFTGNGASNRTIELGFRPRFGYLFAANENTMDGDAVTYQFDLFFAFFSELGCSFGVSLTNTGVNIRHSDYPNPSGSSAMLNKTGVKYVYVAFR